MTGYISVHRKMMDSAIWSDPNYLKLWMYCLFKAGYKEREILLGNTMIKLSVGQFVTGRKVLTDEMNKGVKPEQKLSEKSWERYLKNLEKWEMLTIEVTNKYSVVTVVKYGVYQNKTDEVDQLVDQQLTINCPTTDQQVTTNNKVNKVNNVKKELKPSIDFESEFEIFWSIYKKKTDRKKAFDKFKITRKKYSLEQIIDGTKKYMAKCDAEGTEKQFIKGPTVFLNGENFNDEFEIEIPRQGYSKPIEQTPKYKPFQLDLEE